MIVCQTENWHWIFKKSHRRCYSWTSQKWVFCLQGQSVKQNEQLLNYCEEYQSISVTDAYKPALLLLIHPVFGQQVLLVVGGWWHDTVLGVIEVQDGITTDTARAYLW